jgi:Cu(I)/Ag(I) efflux system membrane fusion protein
MLLKSITSKIQNYELSVRDVQALEDGKLKLRASTSGVISTIKAKEGDNVNAGQTLLSIADLSNLWAILDVYESDLNRIKKGDELIIRIPNEDNVKGEVVFVSPVLDSNSRSAKARVVITNTNRNLKPGIFITAELGNPESKSASSEALMVPKSAVLWTGKRSVVYQQLENENGVYFKMIEVETGSSSSDHVEILSGLEPGDEIVSQGAFSVDSEAQLAGKPSMMNPKEKPSEIQLASEIISNKTEVVKQLINQYSSLKDALVKSDFKASRSAYSQVNALLLQLNSTAFKTSNQINNIEELREEFILLSEAVITMAKTTNPSDNTLYVQRCPMADRGEGARWLSFSEQIKNPYYGDAMLTCGSVVDSIQ